MTGVVPPVAVGARRPVLTSWDVVAVLLVLGTLVALAEASRGVLQPLPEPGVSLITLDRAALPGYAARTTLRMLAAMTLSLLFTFTHGPWPRRAAAPKSCSFHS